jgi:hypothetical protein
MAVISGGNVNPPVTSGVPSDANIGLPAGSITNGMLAVDVTNGNLYERAAGSCAMRDTL